MRVVCFGNQKGGVGKTTLSVGVAGAWADLGLRVTLIDADPQASAADWLGGKSPIRVFRYDAAGGRLDHMISALKKQGLFDVAVIDLPPGASDSLVAVLKVADLLVIPVQPSGLDIAAAAETIRLGRKAGIDMRFASNRENHSTGFTRAVRATISRLSVPLLKTGIGNRVAHVRAISRRQPVTAHEPKGQAAAEIRSLAREIQEILEL